MARIFLDANYFIDLIENRKEVDPKKFLSHFLYLSPLSIHIFVYLYRQKMPNKNLEKFLENFTIVPIDGLITFNSLKGPTEDFEDNLQLHSAVSSECDIFLTNDKKLQKLHFFGKMRIENKITG